MDTLKTKLLEILRELLAHPESNSEMVVLSLTALLSCLIVMRLSAGAFGLHLDSWPRVIITVFSALVLSLAAAVALRVWVFPVVTSTVARLAMQIAAPALILLAMVIPLQCFLMKGNYLQCLFTLVVSLIAAVVISIAVRAAWQTAFSGLHAMETQKSRKALMEESIAP